MNHTKKNTIDLSNARIGDIVADNYHAAGVFKEFGIDFCCGGGVTLEKACLSKGLNADEVLDKLRQLDRDLVSADQNYNAWEPGFLIDHIEKTHHNFVRSKISEITGYAAKVARVHGERHPENVGIYEKFQALSQEMLDHLDAEEERVFPLIREIYSNRMKGKTASENKVEALREELSKMEDEHEAAGNLMKEIRELSNSFTPPVDACRTWQILYQNLAGFEADLHKHVHLENNILFKKAEQLV